MSFEKLLWVLLFTWVVTCVYYLWKIRDITRANSASIFVQPNKLSKTSRGLLKKQYNNILTATIFFIVAIFLAYFVNLY